MKLLTLIAICLGLVACGPEVDFNGLRDTEHVGYISVAETWREICADRYNKYNYPNEDTRAMLRAECRRKFADGEEVAGIPNLPEV